jgi:hypothetical protein
VAADLRRRPKQAGVFFPTALPLNFIPSKINQYISNGYDVMA